MCLTPRHGNLSSCFISVPIPILSHPIHLNPVFEPAECSLTAYGVTQILPHVLIVYREAEPLHHTILIDLKSVGQREIVIRFYNVPRDTKRVMLPSGKSSRGCSSSAARNSSVVT
jgi:hypothetical protein